MDFNATNYNLGGIAKKCNSKFQSRIGNGKSSLNTVSGQTVHDHSAFYESKWRSTNYEPASYRFTSKSRLKSVPSVIFLGFDNPPDLNTFNHKREPQKNFRLMTDQSNKCTYSTTSKIQAKAKSETIRNAEREPKNNWLKITKNIRSYSKLRTYEVQEPQAEHRKTSAEASRGNSKARWPLSGSKETGDSVFKLLDLPRNEILEEFWRNMDNYSLEDEEGIEKGNNRLY